MIRIIAGGRKSRGWVLEGQEEYLKRLVRPFDAVIEYADDARLSEFARRWPFSGREFVILLDERGEGLSSVELSERLSAAFGAGRKVVMIIGGAYGVEPVVREQADLVLSVSKMVFPHELMRVLLAEQIYRAQEIYRGGKYHHS